MAYGDQRTRLLMSDAERRALSKHWATIIGGVPDNEHDRPDAAEGLPSRGWTHRLDRRHLPRPARQVRANADLHQAALQVEGAHRPLDLE